MTRQAAGCVSERLSWRRRNRHEQRLRSSSDSDKRGLGISVSTMPVQTRTTRGLGRITAGPVQLHPAFAEASAGGEEAGSTPERIKIWRSDGAPAYRETQRSG